LVVPEAGKSDRTPVGRASRPAPAKFSTKLSTGAAGDGKIPIKSGY
jgi:hypothetical protein